MRGGSVGSLDLGWLNVELGSFRFVGWLDWLDTVVDSDPDI